MTLSSPTHPPGARSPVYESHLFTRTYFQVGGEEKGGEEGEEEGMGGGSGTSVVFGIPKGELIWWVGQPQACVYFDSIVSLGGWANRVRVNISIKSLA